MLEKGERVLCLIVRYAPVIWNLFSGNRMGWYGNANGMDILLRSIWKRGKGFYEGIEMGLEKVITVLLCVALVGSLGVLIGHLRSYNLGYIAGVREGNAPCICDMDCDCEDCQPCICQPYMDCPREAIFLRIARDVAEEVEYDRAEWNCLDKSEEIVRRLEDSEWKGKFEVVLGLMLVSREKEDGTDHRYWSRHAWVCSVNRDICMESTKGWVIERGDYEKNYRED